MNEPANPFPAKASKLPDAARSTTRSSKATDHVSFGLLSMVVGGFALSLDAVPPIRFLAVLLSLGGLTLAVLEFRSKDKKAGPHFARAVAGTTICAIVLLITIVRPIWSARNPRAGQARPVSNTTSTAETAPLAVSDNPQQATTASNDAALPPQAAVPAPQFVPFPCGKHLPLVPVEIEEQEPADSTAAATEQPKPRFAGAKNPPAPKAALSAPKAPRKPLQWIDASAAAAQEGDVCVCVASAGIERLSFSTGGKTTAQTSDTLVIHLQVILVGTSRKVDFTGWSNANFGDAQHKPSLFDGAKKPYRLQTFSRDARIVDHERPTGLYPKFYADDFLYFEVPAAHVESLRLELPESAFGGMNTIRFLIPGAMIDGRNETPPKT